MSRSERKLPKACDRLPQQLLRLRAFESTSQFRFFALELSKEPNGFLGRLLPVDRCYPGQYQYEHSESRPSTLDNPLEPSSVNSLLSLRSLEYLDREPPIQDYPHQTPPHPLFPPHILVADTVSSHISDVVY